MKALLVVALAFVLSPSVSGQTLNEHMEFIEHWEGRRAEVYLCPQGYMTIGVGHKVNRYTSKLTEKQIDSLLKIDTLAAIKGAKETVVSFNEQPKTIRLILVDMVFNLGARGLSRFEKTIDACNKKDYRRMSNEMEDSLWYEQTGRRAKHHVQAVKSVKN